jgi:hypothetical protein
MAPATWSLGPCCCETAGAQPGFVRENYAKLPEHSETFQQPSRFSQTKGRLAMADKRALKLIGMLFGALTLMVISTAAAVVAGHAASGTSLDYQIGRLP